MRVSVMQGAGIFGALLCGLISDKFFNHRRNVPALIFGVLFALSTAAIVWIIDRMIQNSIYDFEEIRKCLDRCQKYVSMLYYQKNIIIKTNYKYEVCFYKRKYDKIYYYVELEKIPLMLNGFKYKSILSSEKFTGKERFYALKRAHDLAKDYNCLLRDLVNRNKE